MDAWRLIEIVIARGTVPFLVALVYIGVGAKVIRRAERGAGVATIVAGVGLLMQVGLVIFSVAVLRWQIGSMSTTSAAVSMIGLPLMRWSLHLLTAGATLVAAVRLARAVRAAELARAR
jgi:hypothetical protein